MKILMIVPEPFFSPRGTPFSVYYRTQTLGRLGHEVDVVTYHIGRDVTLPNTTVHRIPKVPFISKVKVGPSFAKLILDVFVFFKTFWMLLTKKYDVVHAHEEAVFFCLVYKMFLWRLKIVYDMHSSLPQQLRNFAFTKSGLLVGVFDLLERWSIRKSSVVITICPELQKVVEDLRVPTPSIMIENSLFHEIDYQDRGDEIPDTLINWRRFEGKHVVLYTGTFEHYQGIPLLLESVNAVVAKDPNAVFVLIGGAPQQLIAMREMAERLRVKDHVIFTGTLHPNTVKRFLKRADVLVSPRMTGNNSPLKIYEYLSSGRPIVATNLETHTQILTDKESILVDCTAGGLAEGILRVLGDKALAESLGANARALYEKAYGQQIYQQKLQKVFSHVK